MNNEHYFKRVNKLTLTKFWINNVTQEQARLAIDEGAVGCTQNPSYVWKMLNDKECKEHVDQIIDKLICNYDDDNEVLIAVQRELVGEIANIFLPLYESSDHKKGYVSIQGDPFNEDSETIIKYAKYNREISPNIMNKIPVTYEGLKAIEYLAANRFPINATEVMTVKQALDVCELYEKATKGLKDKAPIYFSHITGILDEYLAKYVLENNIDISEDVLWQAGIAAAKKTYFMAKEKNPEVGFIGGGARGLHHFTEMVGGDVNITINWKGTADELIKQNPLVLQRFLQPTPYSVIDELNAKIPDFRKAYNTVPISSDEYETFGPVVLFRNSFEEAWSNALTYISNKRKLKLL